MTENGRKGKTAVVFVHGQGEHVPLGSAPELARSTWATDPKAKTDAGGATEPGAARVKLSPDASIGDEEIPRATVPAKSGVDFFEFYWSDLMTGNQFAHVWRWFRNLIRKPAEETPRRILPVRQLFIRVAEVGGVFIAAFALFTVTVGVLLADRDSTEAPEEFFKDACWSTGRSVTIDGLEYNRGPLGWPDSLMYLDDETFLNLPELRSATLHASLGIPELAGSNTYRSVCELGDFGLAVTSAGRSIASDPNLQLLPARQRTQRLGCQTLDAQMIENARRVVSCVEWRALQTSTSASGHTQGVVAARYDRAGDRILTNSYDGTLRIWDAASGVEVQTLEIPNDYAFVATFSPDGQLVAAALGSGVARIWNAETRVQLGSDLSHGGTVGYGAVSDVVFSPDGSRLATAGSDGTAKIWNAITGQELATLTGHQGAVSRVRFSPDGQRVITAAADSTARIWNLNGVQVLPEMRHADWVIDAVFSPDGALVATSSWDYTVRIWNAATAQAVTPALSHDGYISGIAFSPDSSELATSSDDTIARIWAVAGKSVGPIATLDDHYGAVSGVTYSPDGARLLTWSTDATARLWDRADTSSAIAVINHADVVTSGAFSPDGASVVTSSDDTTARISDLSGGTIAQLGDAAINSSEYRSATTIATENLAALRSSMPPIMSDEQEAAVAATAPTKAESAAARIELIRYFTSWLVAREQTEGAYWWLLRAPAFIAAVVLFILLSDWSGVARRMAATAPHQIQRRFQRRPGWLYVALAPISAAALASIYAYLASNVTTAGVGGLIAFALSTLVLGGLLLFSLGRLARHLVDADALKSIGAQPASKRRVGKRRPWTVLLWTPLWAATGLAVMLSTGLQSALFLLAVAVPIVADVMAFSARMKLARRNIEIARWPFPWHLVNAAAFAVAAIAGTGLTAFWAPLVSGVLALAAVAALIGAFVGALVYLTDPRGGGGRHLAFALLGSTLVFALASLGLEVAANLTDVRSLAGFEARLIAGGIYLVVVLALGAHLLRALIGGARRFWVVRNVLFPLAYATTFVVVTAAGIIYLGQQIEEEVTLAEVDEQINSTLLLRDLIGESSGELARPLERLLDQSTDLAQFTRWTYFLQRREANRISRQDPSNMLTPVLPGGREVGGRPSLAVRGASFGAGVYAIAFDPLGSRIATANSDGAVELWPLSGGGAPALISSPDSFSYIGQLTFGPDGSILAGSDYSGLVTLWSTPQGGDGFAAFQVAQLDAGGGSLPVVAFHPFYPVLATASYSGVVTLWDIDPYSLNAWQAIATLDAHRTSIVSMEFSPDGRHLATGDLDGQVVLWDADQFSSTYQSALARFTMTNAIAKQVDPAASAGLRDLTISPDGTRLAAVSDAIGGFIWDIDPLSSTFAREIARFSVPNVFLNTIAFSLDQNATWLASGNSDNTISLWDPTTGNETTVLRGHDGGVMDIAWSPSGTELASIGWDYRVRLWSADPSSSTFATEIANLSAGSYGAASIRFGFTRDATAEEPTPLLAAAGYDGLVRMWDLSCLAVGEPEPTIDPVDFFPSFAKCAPRSIFQARRAAVERAGGGEVIDADPLLSGDPYDLFYDDAMSVDSFPTAEPASDSAEVFPADAAVDAAADPFAVPADDVAAPAEAAPFPITTAPAASLVSPTAPSRDSIDEIEDRILAATLVGLRNELPNVDPIDPIQFALFWAAIAVLVLIFFRMLVASLTIAIISAPFALFAAFTNMSELGVFGQDDLFLGLGAVSFEQSPLRLVNGVYAFFLAFCVCWFAIQVLRELLNITVVRGLSLIAVALSAAFGVWVYELGAYVGLFQASWTIAIILVIMVVVGGLFAAAHYFLVPIMADSARYLSPKPQNIARRREIVDRGVRLLRALSRSGRYDRIVVVAHSLGTLVAFDAVSRFWTNFEDSAARPDVRQNRSALLSASTALSRGVHDALSGAADDLALARRPARPSKHAAPAPTTPVQAPTDEKRADRLCEVLSEIALSYGKAGKPRRSKRKLDPEAAARKVKGAAARVEAADALWIAIRAIRVGPASFGDAVENLRRAANLVRSAHGIDPDAPSRFSLSSKRALGEAEATAGALESSANRLAAVAPLFERYLDCQQRFAAALSSGPAEERWLVTDLITMGSPLTHGEYLLGADHRVRTSQEGPEGSAPANKPLDALKGRLAIEQQATQAIVEGSAPSAALEDLEAAFPASRWTNLFFRGEGVLGGDIVGGPIWTVFGPGVVDVPLDGKPNNSSFAHNEYWKSGLDDRAMCDGEAPDHILALRHALRLVEA